MVDYHSFWIRIGQYLKKISEKHEVIISEKKECLKLLERGDVLILYRHRKDWGDICRELITVKKLGVKVISDVDDYLWNDGELRGWNKDRQKYYFWALRHCDLITCSTKSLKDQLQIMLKGQQIYLIMNTAPAWDIKNKRDEGGLLRIGGLVHHGRDLKIYN